MTATASRVCCAVVQKHTSRKVENNVAAITLLGDPQMDPPDDDSTDATVKNRKTHDVYVTHVSTSEYNHDPKVHIVHAVQISLKWTNITR